MEFLNKENLKVNKEIIYLGIANLKVNPNFYLKNSKNNFFQLQNRRYLGNK
jgi:hypothetical protein